jgi:hypothetical protein
MTLDPDTFDSTPTDIAALSGVAPGRPLHSMTLYGIREEQPGPRWQALHDATRNAYHRWYLSEGAAARPDLRTCRRMLVSHMPELVPVWERLVDIEARFLNIPSVPARCAASNDNGGCCPCWTPIPTQLS